MYTLLMIVGGIFWSLTYILIIRQGYKDKTYSIPLVALCAATALYSFAMSYCANPVRIYPILMNMIFHNYQQHALGLKLYWEGLDDMCPAMIFLLANANARAIAARDIIAAVRNMRLYASWVGNCSTATPSTVP